MKSTLFSILFMATILLSAGIVASIDLLEDADAVKSKGTKVRITGSSGSVVCGDRLCSDEGATEPLKSTQKTPPEPEPTPDLTKPESAPRPEPEPEPTPTPRTETKTEQKEYHGWQFASGTLTSSQDPGIGHETHQLAIILPPTSNVYKGILSYDASEDIQLVALHGPLGPDDAKGQAIWSPDGKTKFALTLIDPETSMGSWIFTGNAIALHTPHSEKFTTSYSVGYMEKEPSNTVKTGTVDSIVDPGIGHETHQLAMILPPSGDTYSGLLTYSASEPIQLVALHGPIDPDTAKGQAVWSSDGKTLYGLTFVNPETSSGTWAFAGNALAVHTLREDQFTVSFSVVAGQ